MAKADRIGRWLDGALARAKSEDGLAGGYAVEAAYPGVTPDDARVLRGQAEVARVRARAEWAVVKILERLEVGEEVESRDETEGEVRRLTETLRDIACHGHTRPLEMGEGNDGDGHWKRIAQSQTGMAARAVLKDEK